jgi:tRNA(Ile2) C34 agmatinyltransferase TiaS
MADRLELQLLQEMPKIRMRLQLLRLPKAEGNLMPICPKCHGAWLMQTEDPNRFICLDCKTEYELKPVEKQNRQQK